MRSVLALILGAVLLSDPSAIDRLGALDRGVQAEAVAELADGCDGCEARLIELWETTDRFDVRVHVVRVFEARGAAGVPHLVELAMSDAARGTGGEQTLVHRALARQGKHALEALVAAAMGGESRLVYTIWCVATELDEDLEPIARALLGSESEETRASVLSQLERWLPVWTRCDLLLAALDDPSDRVRAAGAAYPGYPVIPEPERRASPERFERYLDRLVQLLDSEDTMVVRGAALTIAAHKVARPGALDRLLELARDPSLEFVARMAVMRAALSLSENPRATATELGGLIDEYPFAVCQALATVEPEAISDELVVRIVETLPSAGHRDGNDAADLIVMPGSSRDRRRLGLRALDALVEALVSGDDDLARLAANVIRDLGEPASAAVPTLVQQLDHSNAYRAGASATALTRVAPDDPRVRAALAAFIRRDLGDPAHRGVSGELLWRLVRERPDDPWVRELAAPAFHSPDHPLHRSVMRSPPAEVADIIEPDVPRIIQELLDAPARDEKWAFAQGRGPEPDPVDLLDERDRRSTAARALAIIDTPPTEVIDAFVEALRSDVLEAPEPSSERDPHRPDRRGGSARFVWETEIGVAYIVAGALASALSEEPRLTGGVIDALAGRPVALSLTLTGLIRDGQPGYRLLDVPADLPPATIDAALEALLARAETPTKPEIYQGRVIAALGNLPTDDPRRVALLRRLVLYGQREAPRSALAALGRVRPVTRSTLDMVREHLDDPRWKMRSAALAAAGYAGPDARPLIDELVALGADALNSSTGSFVASALEKIDPDDPRVIEYLESHRAATAGR
jgi:hypothetical protein